MSESGNSRPRRAAAPEPDEFEDPNPPTDAWINEIRDALPLYDDAHKDVRHIIEQDQRRRAGCS